MLFGLVLLVLLVYLDFCLFGLVISLTLHLLQVLYFLFEVGNLPVQSLALLSQLLVKPCFVRVRSVKLADLSLLVINLLLFGSHLLFKRLQLLLFLAY